MNSKSQKISGLKLPSEVHEAVAFSREAVLTVEQVRQVWGPPATLGAPEKVRLALDSRLESEGVYTLLQHSMSMGVYGVTPNFLGYGALQNIAQNGLMRACIETVADDMTREWVEFTQEDAEDDEPDQEKLAAIEKEFKRLGLQKVMHDACCMVGYYGGCLLYLDTGAVGPDLELPLSLESWGAEASRKGFLRAVRVIDPVNCFPGTYNSIDPLRSDFYVPKTWWILGKQVHASRLIRVFANEPPLLCKPAYNFLGIPQAQILWDYVAHFQANRDSANRLLSKFSTTVFKTDLADFLHNLSPSAVQELRARMGEMAYERRNDSIIALDKDTEDMVKLETPLGGVPEVVRQSLEQVACLNRTPAVKLLGISPSGFNATGESDIRNYYDHVKSQQEKVIRPVLQRILSVVQTSLFGKVDKGLSFDFCSLSEEDEGAKIQTQTAKIQNICTVLDRDIIDAEEARKMLIADPDSGFDGLDPELPEQPEGEDPMQALMGGGQPENISPAAPLPTEQPAGTSATPPVKGPSPQANPTQAPANDFKGAVDAKEGEPDWITLENGTHVPVGKGETHKEATESFLAGKNDSKTAASSKAFTRNNAGQRLLDLGFERNEKGDYYRLPNDFGPALQIEPTINAFKNFYTKEKLENVIAEYEEKPVIATSPDAKLNKAYAGLARLAYAELYGGEADAEAGAKRNSEIKAQQREEEFSRQQAEWEEENRQKEVREQLEDIKTVPAFSDKGMKSSLKDNFVQTAVPPSYKSHDAILTPELSQREERLLRDYTGPAFTKLNELARKDSQNSEVSMLESMLQKSETSKPLILFRGHRGENGHEPSGFVSSTTDFETARQYAGRKKSSDEGSIYEIHLPKGSHALSVQEYSRYPEEEEILLPRGTKFRTKGYRQIGSDLVEIVEPVMSGKTVAKDCAPWWSKLYAPKKKSEAEEPVKAHDEKKQTPVKTEGRPR